MTTQQQTSIFDPFFNAVVLATALGIARMFAAGDVQAASNRLEQHLSALDDSAAAVFMATVKQFIEKGG